MGNPYAIHTDRRPVLTGSSRARSYAPGMAEPASRELSRRRGPKELEKLRTAVRQLEMAELYLAAAVNLEFADPEVRDALDLLYREVVGTRERLLRPRLVG